MKLTKRIAAIAATAVMAITSAVGMSASAIEISDCTNSVCSEQPRLLPTLLPGKYTHSTGTGYIEISNDGKCTLYNVFTDDRVQVTAYNVKFTQSNTNDFAVTLTAGTYTVSSLFADDGNGTDRYIQGIVSGTFSNKITTNYGEVYTKK